VGVTVSPASYKEFAGDSSTCSRATAIRAVDNRLQWHTHAPSGHTVNHRPWSLPVAIEFPTESDARRFERYLKTGSGRAFAKRHVTRSRRS